MFKENSPAGYVRFKITAVRDGRPGEIEGVTVIVHDYLDCVWVIELVSRYDGVRQSGHYGLRVIYYGGDHGINHVRSHLRLVTLNVYNDVYVRVKVFYHFSHSLSSGIVTWGRHFGAPSETFYHVVDTLVIGCNYDTFYPFCLLCSGIDMLDNIFPGDSLCLGQYTLAWKPCRAVSCWYNGIGLHADTCYQLSDSVSTPHPFITPSGFNCTTFRAIPALCTTSTTSVTSLYASGISSASVRHPEALTITPRSCIAFTIFLPPTVLDALLRLISLPAP